jgi:hypothetical protein
MPALCEGILGRSAAKSLFDRPHHVLPEPVIRLVSLAARYAHSQDVSVNSGGKLVAAARKDHFLCTKGIFARNGMGTDPCADHAER